ncbi:MAG TPA: divergent PAP2 family protein [Candidatus Acidoferrum sp.]|nr:divergent PAP2 family protein [Candidatus Acidoferrum sp.]
MDYGYLLTPLLGWFAAGTIKFLINSVRSRRLAFDLIGYGGMPSTHSAVVTGTTVLIALREGIGHPAFAAAFTLLFIVILDASSLRRQVGHHAAAINTLLQDQPHHAPLRERMGHSKLEIVAGIVVGIAVAVAVRAVTA